MKHNLRNSHSIALLGCALLGLSATSARCQILPRGSAAPVYTGSLFPSILTRSTVYNPPFSSRYINGLAATVNPYYVPNYYANYAPNYPGYSAVTTSIGQRSFGSQSQPTQPAGGAVTAQVLSYGQLLVQWSGNANWVQEVTLGIFDANGRMLGSNVITSLPIQAVFTLPATASYYGARVQYLNGMTNTLYSPIQ